MLRCAGKPWVLRSAAFTLIELLVVLAVLAVLIGLTAAGIGRSFRAANEVECLSRMRQAASGLISYASEHHGQLPRSSHSAYAARQRGWAREILPYLGYETSLSNQQFWELASKVYRCPSDTREGNVLSYGINVYFELDPQVDDYPGSPQQWQSTLLIPEPSKTILLAEVGASGSSSDHVMAHFWGGLTDAVEVDALRHDNGSFYAFLDGSVRKQTLNSVFDEKSGVNLWNPERKP